MSNTSYIHDFEEKSIGDIERLVYSKKEYIKDNNINKDESIDNFIYRVRRTLYEKNFTKTRIAELQAAGYIDNPVYSPEYIESLIGAINDPQEEQQPSNPSWMLGRSEFDYDEVSSEDMELIDMDGLDGSEISLQDVQEQQNTISEEDLYNEEDENSAWWVT